MLKKPISLYVYKNENGNPKAPTHSWSGFVFREDLHIKAGTKVDLKFWGNSTNKEGKANPNLQITNHDPKYAKKDGDKGGVADRDINYPSKSQMNEQDFLDDDIKI